MNDRRATRLIPGTRHVCDPVLAFEHVSDDAEEQCSAGDDDQEVSSRRRIEIVGRLNVLLAVRTDSRVIRHVHGAE